jgi:leucyl-tRNA synthetase
MSMGPAGGLAPVGDRAVVGAQRFLQRAWRAIVDEHSGAVVVADTPADEDTRRVLHRTIAGVREDMADLRFNTAIAKLIELTNALTKLPRTAARGGRTTGGHAVAVRPAYRGGAVAQAGSRGNHYVRGLPVADAALLVEDTVTYPVQVNGKVRARVSVPASASEEAVREAALAEVGIADPKKVIVVPGRLVSVVA